MSFVRSLASGLKVLDWRLPPSFDLFFFFKFKFSLFIYVCMSMLVGVCLPRHENEGERTALGSWFSSTTQVSGIELGQLGLEKGFFTC